MSGHFGDVLESGFIADISKSKKYFEDVGRFHWEYYSELAYLRNKIYDQLKTSLRDEAKPFKFSAWQRAVKFKYSLSPLSAKGSLVDPGGRFNIGEIDPARFPIFPALYLASDKSTALAELLGRDGPANSLSPEELALTKSASITIVSISGELESALDVRDANRLAAFVNSVKDFKVSGKLLLTARKLGQQVKILKTPTELVQELANPRWREWPTAFDVPGPPQIFGRIAMDAGIEGLIYNSVLTQGPCLACFPQNFANSSSFIELNDVGPVELVNKRIDSHSFKNFL